MAKPASLTSNLLVTKGTATPAKSLDPTEELIQQLNAIPVPDVEEPEPESESEEPEKFATISRWSRQPPKDYHKSLTVKLDKERYFHIKEVGLKYDKSSQELFIEALDALLARKCYAK
ncbi:MAG: hypothetical protein QX194_06600 [Methylococcales bacterium]